MIKWRPSASHAILSHDDQWRITPVFAEGRRNPVCYELRRVVAGHWVVVARHCASQKAAKAVAEMRLLQCPA